MSRATRAFVAIAAAVVLVAKPLSTAFDKPFIFVIIAFAGLIYYAALPSIIATINSITGLKIGLSISERLFRASAENDVKTAKRLLEEGAGPNEPVNSHYAIGAAAEQGHIKIVDLLLHAGADPNLSSKEEGITPLMGACVKGYTEITKRLLDAGADPKAQDLIGISPLTIASIMGHLACVKLLLGRGADINVQAKDGATPLIAAAAMGKAEMVSYLLASGANSSMRTMDGKTAFEVARGKGYDSVAQALEKR